MSKSRTHFNLKLVISGLVYLMCGGPLSATETSEGKAIAFDRAKGNCLTCHAIEDGELPGNIGPPLFNMKQRFSSINLLRNQVWDATERNPKTSMPPYGRNKILSEDEIDLVVQYIWSL